MPIPYIEYEDVSGLVAFLLSDESRYMTGRDIRLDAGAMHKGRMPFNSCGVAAGLERACRAFPGAGQALARSAPETGGRLPVASRAVDGNALTLRAGLMTPRSAGFAPEWASSRPAWPCSRAALW